MYLNFIFTVFICTLSGYCYGEDYYELLGLSRNADQKTIRQAFKKLAITLHPDKNNDDPDAHNKFLKYTKAYETLKDPELRKKYDLYGEEGLDSASNNRQQYHSWSYYQQNFGIYDDDPQVVTLNANDYDDNVINSEKLWMINFYSPMCGHCHTLAPVWRRIAKDYEGVIRVGAVNCEDDWRLCRQLGINSYPTIMYYPKNSQHGIRYTNVRNYDEISDFIMEHLDVHIEKISNIEWTRFLNGYDIDDKPMLIFTCGINRQCFDSDEHLKIAAVFDNIIDVGLLNCDDINCNEKLSPNTGAVFFKNNKNFSSSVKVKSPIFFDDLNNADEFVHKILEQLPEPQDLTIDDYEAIKKRLEIGEIDGWLLCFYIGHETELDLQLKRLPSVLHDVHIGKINCARYSVLCSNLNINRYPMWLVLKPGGAFEVNHGKNTINDVARFAENSIKAQNVWALTADKIMSILKRESGSEVWFLDWYAPWCPPCMHFLPELRKASLEFDKSTVHFGTVDCTVHTNICRQYNIRSYPTAMLINGTVTSQFTMKKTAANIVEFIREFINPTVIKLNSDNFYKTIGKKKDDVIWVVDYFAPWCGPCQHLAPEWMSVAKTMDILPNVKIASVDCEAEAELCRNQGVRSYPNIRLYPLDSYGLNRVSLFNGQRDALSIMKWIASFLPVKIREFNEETLERDVFNSKKYHWIVDYYSPWCDHCQLLEPHYAIAAQLLHGKIKFGQFNCDKYRSECGRIGIRAYPTLIIYPPKNKRKTLNGAKYGGFTATHGTTAGQLKDEIQKYLNLNASRKHDEL